MLFLMLWQAERIGRGLKLNRAKVSEQKASKKKTNLPNFLNAEVRVDF